MKAFYPIVALTMLTVSEATEVPQATPDCLFDFSTELVCQDQDLSVRIEATPIAADEKRLQALLVHYGNKQYRLPLTDPPSMLQGDRGYILLNDINFDAIPDIGVTTSFAVANQYLDYWVYDKQQTTFLPIGNYAQFSIDNARQRLSNQVRLNATHYEKNIYQWQNQRLVKITSTRVQP